AYRAGSKTQEPAITSAVIHTIGGGLSTGMVGGLRWEPMVLPSDGPGSAESLYGADALLVLDIHDNGRHIQKGVLVHAKKGRRNDGLEGQCAKMLRLSSAAFVLRYSASAITVERACKYHGQPDRDERWSFEEFVYSFLDCTHGDRKFRAATLPQLETLA